MVRDLRTCADTPLISPCEIGFEKELLIQASSKRDGAVFNLMLAEELITVATPHDPLFTLVPEYSRCLVELVSHPFAAQNALPGLHSLNASVDSIDDALRSLVSKSYPLLAQEYDVFVSDDGSSQSNCYLNPDGTVLNDQEHAAELVLIESRNTVEKYKDMRWKVGAEDERMIGTYNHIQSFHITFHPTYVGDERPFTRYLKALSFAQAAAAEYEHFDNGNRSLVRTHGTFVTDENVRNLFLKKFVCKKEDPLSNALSIPTNEADAEEYFFTLTQKLLVRENTQDVDCAFKSWSSLNVRPRILGGLLLGIEIRQFGSSFSRTPYAYELVERMVKHDSQGYAAN